MIEYDDFILFIQALLIVLIPIFILTWLIILGVYKLNDYPVRIYIENNLIYEGSNSCIDYESAGSATLINIRRGYLCMLPKQKYISSNVKIINLSS